MSAGPKGALSAPVSRRGLICAAPFVLVGCRARASEAPKTNGIVRAADFRGFGKSDQDVLAAAFAAWAKQGGTLELEQGRVYRLGIKLLTSDSFVLEGLDGGTLEGNGATIETHSFGRTVYSLLHFSNCRNVVVRNLGGTDRGYSGQPLGAHLIGLSAGSRDSGPFRFENISSDNLLTLVHAAGPAAPHRVRGIELTGNCRATRTYYGINCQNQGDGLTGSLTTINCRRSYFPYGVVDHDVRITVRHDTLEVAPGAESCALIKSYGRATRNIKLDIGFHGVLAWVAMDKVRIPGSCVTLEHQHDPAAGPSAIENVAITMNVAPDAQDPYAVHRVVLRSLFANAREEEVTRNIWRDISIMGNLRPGSAPALVATCVPSQPVDLHLSETAAQASRRLPPRGYSLQVIGSPPATSG